MDFVLSLGSIFCLSSLFSCLVPANRAVQMQHWGWHFCTPRATKQAAINKNWATENRAMSSCRNQVVVLDCCLGLSVQMNHGCKQKKISENNARICNMLFQRNGWRTKKETGRFPSQVAHILPCCKMVVQLQERWWTSTSIASALQVGLEVHAKNPTKLAVLAIQNQISDAVICKNLPGKSCCSSCFDWESIGYEQNKSTEILMFHAGGRSILPVGEEGKDCNLSVSIDSILACIGISLLYLQAAPKCLQLVSICPLGYARFGMGIYGRS